MGNAIETIPGGDKAIEAYRKVDFAFSVAQYPCGSALYSDVILPVTTFWENVGFISELGTRDAVIACQQVIEPLYEAKTPTEIALMLADKLGVDTHELFPFGEKQAYFNQIASTTVVDSDGKTSVPLATVTQEDLDSWGVEGEPQEGKIAFSELMEKGIYQFDLKPDDNYTYIAYKDFVEDPEKNPLATASGKFEIYSEAHAAAINQLGYSEVDPLPFYAAGPEGYQETFSDWESKTKGEYPYQIYSIHYMGKAHTNFANNAWCQEAFAAPVYMNSQDAAGSGIADGDAVLVESKHGKILRSAYVTDRLMPGVTALPHGGWKDLNAQGIDEGGNDNSLCGTPVTGFGVNAFNSVLVRITKWDGAELSADCEKPRRVLVEG